MNIENIPTPETDAKTFDPCPWNQNGPGRSHCPEVMYPCDGGEWVKVQDSRDLERRLTVAREALHRITIWSTENAVISLSRQTLAATAPKQ